MRNDWDNTDGFGWVNERETAYEESSNTTECERCCKHKPKDEVELYETSRGDEQAFCKDCVWDLEHGESND